MWLELILKLAVVAAFLLVLNDKGDYHDKAP